jgi:hypothetical protein
LTIGVTGCEREPWAPRRLWAKARPECACAGAAGARIRARRMDRCGRPSGAAVRIRTARRNRQARLRPRCSAPVQGRGKRAANKPSAARADGKRTHIADSGPRGTCPIIVSAARRPNSAESQYPRQNVPVRSYRVAVDRTRSEPCWDIWPWWRHRAAGHTPGYCRPPAWVAAWKSSTIRVPRVGERSHKLELNS